MSKQNLNLINLNKNQGFNVTGSSNSLSGFSVSGAGDVNKDGYDDLVIGAYNANKVYVIYGNASLISTINIANLKTYQGFSITGSSGSQTGWSVSGAGDVNKDGYADVIIGAPASAIAYVIYGGKSLPASITLSNLGSLGFSITFGSGDFGYSVSGAGDVNKDGYDDVIIGNSNGNSNIGNAYIIYGSTTHSTSISASSLTSTQGVTIQGYISGGGVGFAVGGAGDFNNDGYADVIIGAPYVNSNAGQSYLIYGGSSLGSTINLNSFSSTRGFTISGAPVQSYSGRALDTAGDFNKDGFSDIIIGASGSNDASYVIFGNNYYLSTVNVSNLGSYGFSLNGQSSSVSTAGDVNGDGYADVIIGAPSANSNAGQSYVVYGSATNPGSISLSSISSNQGFTISGGLASQQSGFAVSNAGDVDNDGYDDITIGAPYTNSNVGESYIIYGAASGFFTPAPTVSPTFSPSALPSVVPTKKPTALPTFFPSALPSVVPTKNPTASPTFLPSALPSVAPTKNPTASPTFLPSALPSVVPTSAPTPQTIQCTNYNVPCIGSSSSNQFIITVTIEGDQIISGGGNDIYVIDTSYVNAITLTIEGFTSTQVINLEYLTGSYSVYNINNLFISYNPTYIILPNSQTLALSGYTGTLNSSNFIFSQNTISPTFAPTTGGVSGSSAIYDILIKAVISATSFLLSVAGGWIFRKKIAFYVLDNWGHNYKLIYKNSYVPLKDNEIGLYLNDDNLVCIIKNKEYLLLIDDSNHNGISRGLHALIITALKNPLISQSFSLIQPEKNQIRDFLITHKYLSPTKTYCFFGSYKELGYVKGIIYNIFLTQFEDSHTKASKKQVRLQYEDTHETNAEDRVTDVENPLHTVNAMEFSRKDSRSIDTTHGESAKSSCVIMSIDAMIELKHVQLQNAEILRFVQNINLIAQDINKQFLSIADSFESEFKFNFEYLSHAKTSIEHYPLVKTLADSFLSSVNSNYTLPEIGNTVLLTAHMGLGHLNAALSSKTDSYVPYVASFASSASFGARLALSSYVKEFREELAAKEQTISSYEAVKHCASVVLTYTLPDLFICAAAKAAMPTYQCDKMNLWSKFSFAGSECYFVYKSSLEPTTEDAITPLVIDAAVAIASYANGNGVFETITNVVAADWMSRLTFDLTPEHINLTNSGYMSETIS